MHQSRSLLQTLVEAVNAGTIPAHADVFAASDFSAHGPKPDQVICPRCGLTRTASHGRVIHCGDDHRILILGNVLFAWTTTAVPPDRPLDFELITREEIPGPVPQLPEPGVCQTAQGIRTSQLIHDQPFPPAVAFTAALLAAEWQHQQVADALEYTVERATMTRKPVPAEVARFLYVLRPESQQQCDAALRFTERLAMRLCQTPLPTRRIQPVRWQPQMEVIHAAARPFAARQQEPVRQCRLEIAAAAAARRATAPT